MNTFARVGRKARSYAGKAGIPFAGSSHIAEPRLLFLFCGKAHNLRDPGARLYREEKLFRAGIDAADPIAREMLGFSPSAAFAGRWSATTWDAATSTAAGNRR